METGRVGPGRRRRPRAARPFDVDKQGLRRLTAQEKDYLKEYSRD